MTASPRPAMAPGTSARWRAVPRPGASRSADEGQVTILLIGFAVVALALVAVVASAAQVHLERTRLAALADLAALAAAAQVSDEAYFASGATGIAPSNEEVEATVESYLAAHPDAAARWTDLRVVESGSPDGRTVRVTLAAVVRPVWVAWVLAPFTDGVGIGAASSARAW